MQIRKGVINQVSEEELEKLYFGWLYDFICDPAFFGRLSFLKLFRYLHRTTFTWVMPMDQNRAGDGTDLRYRFAYLHDLRCVPKEHDPCTVLEMMAALAIRCEDQIMTDPENGNRTGKWFYEMLESLGLQNMDDYNYNGKIVANTVSSFLSRDYSPDGRGGLFYIPHCPKDLRTMEIWYQLMWYLNTIV